MIAFLRRLWLAYMDRADAGLAITEHPAMPSAKFGAKTPTDTYDYLKARRAALKAKTRTATGRKYQRPQKPVDNVVPMRGRKQA